MTPSIRLHYVITLCYLVCDAGAARKNLASVSNALNAADTSHVLTPSKLVHPALHPGTGSQHGIGDNSSWSNDTAAVTGVSNLNHASDSSFWRSLLLQLTPAQV